MVIDAPEPKPSVRLLDDGGLPWQRVSPRLRTARWVTLAVTCLLGAAPFVALALVVSPWFWIAPAAIALVAAWSAYVIARQVPAISWIELPEEIVIRKGRLFRHLSVVPYGRLQYVDLESGPIARRFGLAEIEIHTASPSSGGSLPGLPTAVAEALRERLSARGESERAGL